MSYTNAIGIKKLRTTNQTLTTSYVQLAETDAGTLPANKAVLTKYTDQLGIFLTYTADAGATTPNLFVRVDFGLDGVDANTPPTTWYQETIQDSYASGDSTLLFRDYKFAGSVGVPLTVPIFVPTTAVWARVMVKETLGAGSAGVITGSVTCGEI